MSFEKVKAYFESVDLADRLLVLDESSATVEKAAQALGCEGKQIAKTLSFLLDGKPMLIVMAGDARIDNKKYRHFFGQKAKMIPYDQVQDYIGHPPGGVCPFAVDEDIDIYLDQSLQRFETIYPAAGNGHTAISLSIPELEAHSHFREWIDVTKGWQPSENWKEQEESDEHRDY